MLMLAVGAYLAFGLVWMFFFFFLVGRHECPWHKRTDKLPCTYHFEIELSGLLSPALWPLVLLGWLAIFIIKIVAFPFVSLADLASKMGRDADL